MDFIGDVDLQVGKKAPPRRGRRAGGGFSSSSQSDDIVSQDDLIDSPSRYLSGLNKTPPKSPGDDLPIVPPRSRRTGGWADEAIKSGKRRSANSNVIEQERFRSPDKPNRDDSDDDIPVIPDLDEIQDDDILTQVACAPSASVNRVATYKDLDSDLFKNAAFATLDDVNLQLLTKCLSVEADLKEKDECWTWDLLFTDVASELHNEWEAENVSEKDLQAT